MHTKGYSKHSFYEQYGKRVLDIVVSLMLMLIVSPVMVLTIILLVFCDGWPVFFIQERVGKNGKYFTIYKFRTMECNTEPKNFEIQALNGIPEDFQFKSSLDYRVTRVGAVLRKYSIDELPQLINVLKGDMSIVGPRPEVPSITTLYNDTQKQRLDVKPGITGLAQVNGRSLISHGQKIQYDLFYIENQSLMLDLKIIILTIKTVFVAKGAF
nr:sugar transferase [Lysinibacillus timonensis]